MNSKTRGRNGGSHGDAESVENTENIKSTRSDAAVDVGQSGAVSEMMAGSAEAGSLAAGSRKAGGRGRTRNSKTATRNGPEETIPAEEATTPYSAKQGKAESKVLVVGIGASAGGLAALEQFFDNMPGTAPGIAFVVVVHLSPEHESNLAPIIQNHTAMRVTQVARRVKVTPDTVYVIPPGKQLSMSDGYLNLSNPVLPRGRRLPIDLFFRTLADSHGEQSAAVVLSGTGSDGAIGVTSVKEMGGITLAQEPAEAEHDQMPRSAIATGFIDYVLPVARMGEQLAQYRDNLGKIELAPPPSEIEESADLVPESQPALSTHPNSLHEILVLLRSRTGHNFASYKRSTILRRIERRMQVNDVPTLAGYLAYLRGNPGEIQLLLRDLLISVTNFFRDRKVWAATETEVIPALFRGKEGTDAVVRVWVAGCATGEEAYSMAILLHEYASRLAEPPRLQIFATDLDDRAIAVAREATYPETISIDVSSDRLRKYFTHSGRRYRVAEEVRKSVLFAAHDLLKDPPFSRVDLVSCRNLLIYLNRDAQEQLLSLFHFAIRPNGYLLLGLSESLDGVSHLYTSVDKAHHIYVRRTVPRYVQPLSGVQRFDGSADHEQIPVPAMPAAPARGRSLLPIDIHQNVLEQYAPPSVVVDENYDIVHISAHAGRYLKVAPGEPTHNLLRLVRPELHLDLRSALLKAQRGISSETRRLPIRLDGSERLIRLLVRPVDDLEAIRGYTLVMFDELAESDEMVAGGISGKMDTGAVERQVAAGRIGESVVRQLEEEVLELRGELRATIEQYETTVEELKASNEELQAINEEMRSASEELETSREELQAVNEELLTVNQELKIKIDEVISVNSDLQNLMSSTEIATIFLDRHLRVKRYTPMVEKLFNIIPTDADRPLAHITHKLQYPELLQDIDAVLLDLRPRQQELRTTDGDWYIVRLLPYRTVDEKIDGVVITFVEITERKRTEEALRDNEERYRSLFNWIDEAFVIEELVTDSEGNALDFRFIEANPAFEHQFGVSDVVGKPMREVIPEIEPLWFENFVRVLQTGEAVRFQDRLAALDRWFNVLATRIGGPESRRVAVVFADITVLKQGQVLLENRVLEGTAALMDANRELKTQISAREDAEQELRNSNTQLRDLPNRLLAVQEEERRRIARELHDQIGQYLTGLKLMLEGLSSKRGKVKETALANAVSVLDELTESVRELSLSLRPQLLDDMGLLPALLWHVERYSAQTGIRVDFRHSGLEERLPAEVETAVYRIVQEALTNAARHSGAREVSVQIVSSDQVVLSVEDRGSGFDLDQILTQHSSTGVSSMRERAELLGGQLTIESSPGHGTRLMAEIPLAGG